MSDRNYQPPAINQLQAIEIHQESFENINVMCNSSLPEKFLYLVQKSPGSLGDTKLQIIRLHPHAIISLIKVLQTYQSLVTAEEIEIDPVEFNNIRSELSDKFLTD